MTPAIPGVDSSDAPQQQGERQYRGTPASMSLAARRMQVLKNRTLDTHAAALSRFQILQHLIDETHNQCAQTNALVEAATAANSTPKLSQRRRTVR